MPSQPWVPQRIENKVLAQIFQAVRIEVNDELGVLKSFLEQAAAVLELRGVGWFVSPTTPWKTDLVKRFIQSGNFEGREEKDFYGNSLSVLSKVGKLRVPYSSPRVEHQFKGSKCQIENCGKKMKNLRSILNIEFLVKEDASKKLAYDCFSFRSGGNYDLQRTQRR